MKTKKKSGKTLRKSGKSQGKIREFDGIKKVGTLENEMNVISRAGSIIEPLWKQFEAKGFLPKNESFYIYCDDAMYVVFCRLYVT